MNLYRLTPIASLAVVVLVSAVAGETHQVTSETGVVVTLSESGLNSITLPGGRVFATGTNTFRSGHGDFFKTPLPNVAPGKLLKQGIERPGMFVFNVTHVYEHATVRYVHRINGDDLTTLATVEHLGKSELPLRTPCFGGLTFAFERDATGLVPTWHVSYLIQQGVDIMHPSVGVPIGAVWAADDSAGFGMFTPRHLDRQKVILSKWAKDRIIPARCEPQFYVHDDVEPLCTKAYEWSIRVGVLRQAQDGQSRDWKWLLEPYRAAFVKRMPPLQYEPDDRPMAQFASASKSLVTKDNPYGFNGPYRRFDTAVGVRQFAGMVIPGLVGANGQGCMFWAIQGNNPRGEMFRTDFDVFPPEIEKNLPALAKAFADRGLRMGLCTRPGEASDRGDWNLDGTFRLSPDNPTQMNRLLGRFTKARKLGFSMFYLDTFGLRYDDYRIMVQLRKHLGRDVPTWSEYSTDLMLPYSGRYAEWTEEGVAWVTPHQLEVMRWLMPGASVLCVNRTPQTYDEMGKRKLTPLIEDHRMAGEQKALKKFGDTYLSGNRWKSEDVHP